MRFLARWWFAIACGVSFGWLAVGMGAHALGIEPDRLPGFFYGVGIAGMLVMVFGWLYFVVRSAATPGPGTLRDLGEAIGDVIEGIFEFIGGCLAVIVGLALAFVGLVFFIWLIKRIWEAV